MLKSMVAYGFCAILLVSIACGVCKVAGTLTDKGVLSVNQVK